GPGAGCASQVVEDLGGGLAGGGFLVEAGAERAADDEPEIALEDVELGDRPPLPEGAVTEPRDGLGGRAGDDLRDRAGVVVGALGLGRGGELLDQEVDYLERRLLGEIGAARAVAGDRQGAPGGHRLLDRAAQDLGGVAGGQQGAGIDRRRAAAGGRAGGAGAGARAGGALAAGARGGDGEAGGKRGARRSGDQGARSPRPPPGA